MPQVLKMDKEQVIREDIPTLILILNLNPLNAPIKRHRQANWIKSQNPSVSCIQTHLACNDTQRLKGMEGDLPTKWRAKNINK